MNTEEVNDEEAEEEAQPEHNINLIGTETTSISPYIKCLIEGAEVTALVDTGATISVINKELADQLLMWDIQIPVLPINSVQISNAVGKKICKVSKQLFC